MAKDYADTDNIRIINWWEHPMMEGVKEALEERLPGWSFAGPYCPGKAGHHTFLATKNGEEMWVHVHDTTKEICQTRGERE